MIPKLIHIIWLGSEIPQRVFDRAMKWSTLNQDWSVSVWDDEAVKDLPNYDVSLKCHTLAGRCDVLRYSVIFENGGVYADADIDPIRPIGRVLDGAKFAVCGTLSPLYFLNGFFGEVEGGPAMFSCVQRLAEFRDDRRVPISSTGPGFFTEAVEHIDRRSPAFLVLGMNAFYPYGPSDSPIADAQCPKETIGIHRWEASWKNPGEGSPGYGS